MRLILSTILITIGWLLLSGLILFLTTVLRIHLLGGLRYGGGVSAAFVVQLVSTVVSYIVALFIPLWIISRRAVPAPLTILIAGLVVAAFLTLCRFIGSQLVHIDCYDQCDPTVIPLGLDNVVTVVCAAIMAASVFAIAIKRLTTRVPRT